MSNEAKAPPPEFLVWAEVARAGESSQQSPADELIAEHYLMGRVLSAMEAELDHVRSGTSVRRDFWASVVDFVANFVSMCHRLKEEHDFFSALAPRDPDPSHASTIDALEQEHATAKQLTEEVCDAIATGEWVDVARLIDEYISFMRPHMVFEETHLVRPAQEAPNEPVNIRLRHFFDEREAHALAGKGRRHYLELAQHLCEQAGLPAGLS